MRKFSWLFFFMILVASLSVSQKSAIYTSDLKDYNKAVALFNDNQYASAQLIFDKIKSETGDADKIRLCLLRCILCNKTKSCQR
jgi:hypothetical protein